MDRLVSIEGTSSGQLVPVDRSEDDWDSEVNTAGSPIVLHNFNTCCLEEAPMTTQVLDPVLTLLPTLSCSFLPLLFLGLQESELRFYYLLA